MASRHRRPRVAASSEERDIATAFGYAATESREGYPSRAKTAPAAICARGGVWDFGLGVTLRSRF